jgi:polyphenol oxidase
VPVDVALTAQRRGPLTVHALDVLAPLGVDCFVTDRNGGVSAAPYDTLNLGIHVGDDPTSVLENRRRVADAASVDADHLIMARQEHGSNVVLVEGPSVALTADALVTDDPTVALAVLIADCVPAMLFDPTSSRVSVVHAGWRGLRANVLDRAIEHFARPEHLHVVLGPAISSARYQVGPEVAAQFRDVPDALVPDEADRSRLDLRRVAVHQLVARGVRDDCIYLTREVTDGGGRFFSDRAARPGGRFALVARRRNMSAP